MMSGIAQPGAPVNASDCAWPENRSASRVTDTEAQLFRSILPHGLTVPVLTCVFVALTLLSFAMNLFTVYVIERSDELSWQPRFVLCKNLILSDLLQTLTFGPAVIYSLIQHQTMAFNLWCYLQYVVGGATVFCSLVTITCMALERYLFVCYALQYTVIVTVQRLQKTLILIWVYSVSIEAISVALLLHQGAEERGERFTMGLLCEPDVMEQHMGSPRAAAVFRKVAGSLTLLLCLLVHAFSYFKMYQNASNAVVPFNEVNNAARRTVVFYCGMLLLQLLPLLVKVASDALWEFRGTGATELAPGALRGCRRGLSPTAAGFHCALLVLLLVPPCLNPMVYGLRSVEIRGAMAKLFRRRAEIRFEENQPRMELLPRNLAHPNRAEAG